MLEYPHFGQNFEPAGICDLHLLQRVVETDMVSTEAPHSLQKFEVEDICEPHFLQIIKNSYSKKLFF